MGVSSQLLIGKIELVNQFQISIEITSYSLHNNSFGEKNKNALLVYFLNVRYPKFPIS